MDRVRWGILGCGDVTEIKSGPALQRAPRSELVAVMRRDGAKAADYARRHNVARHYDDADGLIADSQVDAIYVATPTSSHKALVLKCLDAGKRVLVEKPMALDVNECRAMADAAERSGCSLSVAYYRRALPRFEKFREIVQSGTIGAPRAVSIRQMQRAEKTPDQAWKLDPLVNGGGVFVDVQTHALDWLGYVFGPPLAISGDVRRHDFSKPAEDTIAYLMTFADVAATGLCCFAASRDEETVTVFGDKGVVSMGFMRPGPIHLETQTGRSVIEIVDPPHVHQPLVERLIAHYLDGAPNPCSGEDGMMAAKMIDGIFRSYRAAAARSGA